MLARTYFTAALISLSSALAMAQGGFDVVTLYEGSPKRGAIVEMSKDKIGLEVSNVVTHVDVGDVKRVTFADAPALLTSAQASIASGQLEDAVEKLRKIDKADIQRNIVADEVDFYLAYCQAKMALAGSGDKNAAVTAMRTFADNSGTYHYYEANEMTGDLALAVRRPDVASVFYKNVSNAPWPEFKVKAAVLEGNALLAQEKYTEAGAKYQMVITANLNTPLASRQKEFAALGKAKCLGNLNKATEGIKLCENIIANSDSRDGELFSRAYNALGACHLAAGKEKDALLAYLHVDLLFYQDPSQHAEALYHLIDLWKTENEADRALKSRSLLKSRYPGSVWASKAG